LPGAVDPDRGFVFAATGEKYAMLARRAARTLRLSMPDAAVDLYTDQPVTDSVFDRIHPVDHIGPRPKMEALCRARFARSVYLDCDVIVICAVDEVFELLDRFDIVGAQVLNRGPWTRRRAGIPASFAQINSGVLGIRRSEQVQELMARWVARMAERGDRTDQPALREVLYHSDLRLGILPPAYNLLFTRLLYSWPAVMGAPRLLHCRELHKRPPGDPLQPFTLEEGLGEELADYVRALLRFEPTIRPGVNRQPDTPHQALLRNALHLLDSAQPRDDRVAETKDGDAT
jgi:hypothetical protein